MFKIATPVCHLFREAEQAKLITEYSDCFEVRDECIGTDVENIEVFHCEAQPIHRLHEEVFQYLQRKRTQYPRLRLVTFHCASNCDTPHVKDGLFHSSGIEYNRQEMIINARHNFTRIKKIFGDTIALGIENNNYYPTSAYRFITDPDFISDLIMENELCFLFDMAHARITAQNKDISYGEYKSKLPLARITQIHISSCTFENGLARDTHDAPDKEILNETRDMIVQYKPQYVTVEYYKNYEILLSTLRELRGMQNELSRPVL